MLVRIRFSGNWACYAPHPEEVALACASLLVPSALLAFTLAVWSIAADLRWTHQFIVVSGTLSHWQAWFCIAAVLLLLARVLNRYGSASEEYNHRNSDILSRFL